MAIPRRLTSLLTCILAVALHAETAPASTKDEPTPPHGIPFTESERAWMEARPEIRVGVDPAWPPFSFIDEKGDHRGISADLLLILSHRLGLKFQIVPTGSWQETETLLRAGRIDLAPSVARTEERENALIFTKPYVAYPVAVIMRDDAPFWTGPKMLSGRTVAVPKGYGTTAWLAENYPNIELLLTKNAAEALFDVASGAADACVENLVTANRVIRSEGLANLKVVGIVPYRFEQRIALPRDRIELAAILDKGIASLEPETIFAIEDKWISVDSKSAVNWPLLGVIVAAALGLIGLIVCVTVLWSRKLGAELAERRKVERELGETNAKLRELNEQKEMFMHMAAHDISGPLGAITMGVELARMTVPEGYADAHLGLEQAGEGIDRMRTLLRHLLSSEAIRSGLSGMTPKVFSFSKVVCDVLRRHRQIADAKSVDLAQSGFGDMEDDGGFEILADETLVGQVVENLVSNAVKFSKPGDAVRVSLEAVGDRVRFEVADEGPGITAEEMPRLFEKFSRLSARPTAGESSTGLGLSIVKNLVDSQGGTIRCESSGGQGARFVVEFRAAERGAATVS